MMSRLLIVAATGVVLLAAPVLTQTASAAAASPAAGTIQRPMVKTVHEGRHSLYWRAQLKLKSMKDYAGPVDGRRHTSYVRALERFQTAHHLRANGRLTPRTQRALGI